MSKDELLARLREAITANEYDKEAMHIACDKLLLEYIDSPEITAMYEIETDEDGITETRFWYS